MKNANSDKGKGCTSLMKGCIQLVDGDPSSLVVSDSVPMPAPGPQDILIRVNFAGVNQLDLIQARGGYKLPPGASETLGLEISGTVIQVGIKCQKGFVEGDDVIALLTSGGYGEFVSCDERTVMPAVSGLSQAENASIPESFITAYGLLFFTAQVKAGDNILVHAGASSVGQCLIQMAARKGARVVATTRSPSKVETCLKRGAAEVIVLSNANFTHKALAAGIPDWRGVEQYRYFNSVFDPVGANYLESNVDVLMTDGTLVLYGLLNNSASGAMSTPSLLSKILFKRISVLPSTLRSRDILYKADLIQCFMGDPVCGYAQLGKDYSSQADLYGGDAAKLSRTVSEAAFGGHMVVQVDSVFPLEEVLQAHAKMRSAENVGKIVLSISNAATALDWFAKQLNDIKF